MSEAIVNMTKTLSVLVLAVYASGATVEIAAGPPSAGNARVHAELKEPFAVTFGANGAWYICEYKGHRITRIDRLGKVSVIAGTGVEGDTGHGGRALEVQFSSPHEILLTRAGRMYIADTLNHRVRMLDLESGTITPVAGTGEKGFSGDGGLAAKATFNQAYGIALSPDEQRLYVCDTGNRRVRVVDLKTGMVSTAAGNGTSAVPNDGERAAEAPLVDPRAVAVAKNGEVYILERRGNALRVVGTDGRIRTAIAPGSIKPELNGPKHLAIDRNGDVLIADTENHMIRHYSLRDRTVTTIVGTGTKGSRVVAGKPQETELLRPHGVAVHPNGDVYISDTENNRILRVRR
jgi:DNA-binding beta-propeller fold protein YncE